MKKIIIKLGTEIVDVGYVNGEIGFSQGEHGGNYLFIYYKDEACLRGAILRVAPGMMVYHATDKEFEVARERMNIEDAKMKHDNRMAREILNNLKKGLSELQSQSIIEQNNINKNSNERSTINDHQDSRDSTGNTIESGVVPR